MTFMNVVPDMLMCQKIEIRMICGGSKLLIVI